MDGRSFTCGRCHGIVAIPKGRRTLTLEAVRETHELTCPSIVRVRKEH